MIYLDLSPRAPEVGAYLSIGSTQRLNSPTEQQLNEQARELADLLRKVLPELVLNYLRRSL